MSDVTKILNAINEGNPKAADELLPLVYEELRLLAAKKMSYELPGQTLQATALVHEAYIRLVGNDARGWDNKGHFFKAAAEAMRRILIDNARRKKSLKRSGEKAKVELVETDLPIKAASDDILALDEALIKLQQQNELATEAIKLYYFAGLTLDQIAAVQNISRPTIVKYLAYGRAWLNRELSGIDKS
jgi:RNA polymerase sigma factor (TIGR02999 family)